MKEKVMIQDNLKRHKVMELAVLGLGRWGGGPILKTLSECFPDFIIHGFARSNYLQWQAKKDLPANVRIHGARDYQSDLLDKPEIQALVIATESSSHYRFTKEALEAGKDVLVEKPIAQSKEEAAALVELADAQKRILAVGYTLMYDPTVQGLKEILTTSLFGQVEEIKLNLLNPLAGRKLDFTASVIEDFVPHMLSILHVLLGVRAVSEVRVESPKKERAEISFNYDQMRVKITIDRDYNGSAKERSIRVLSANTAIDADLIQQSFAIRDQRGLVLDQADWRFPSLRLQETLSTSTPLSNEFQGFCEAIQTRNFPRNAAKLTSWIPDTVDTIRQEAPNV